MASTKTFIYETQETPAGSIDLTLISTFSGSGNTNFSPGKRIVNIGNLKAKLPRDANIFGLENIAFELSDLDDYFMTNVVIYGTDMAINIEIILRIDSIVKFNGYLDLKSIQRNEKEKLINFIAISKIAELKNKSLEVDLKPLIVTESKDKGDAVYYDYFNIKTSIEKMLSLVGYAAIDISWNVDVNFYGGLGTPYTFEQLWHLYDHFFGSTRTITFVNCFDLLKSFCLKFFSSTNIYEDKVRFNDLKTTSTVTLENIISQTKHNFFEETIDGLLINVVEDTTFNEKRGDFDNGQNAKQIDLYNVGLSANWILGDDGGNRNIIAQIKTNLSTIKQGWADAAADYYWDLYSSQHESYEIQKLGENSVFDKFTIGSKDFQIIEVDYNILKNENKIIARNI